MTRKASRCTICNKVIAGDSPTFPFCSERCRLNDLGNWLGEHYRVPGAEEEDSDAPELKPLADDDDPPAHH